MFTTCCKRIFGLRINGFSLQITLFTCTLKPFNTHSSLVQYDQVTYTTGQANLSEYSLKQFTCCTY